MTLGRPLVSPAFEIKTVSNTEQRRRAGCDWLPPEVAGPTLRHSPEKAPASLAVDLLRQDAEVLLHVHQEADQRLRIGRHADHEWGAPDP
jgi:hypothetical protein